MKPADQWREELAGVAPGEDIELVEGRGGELSLKVGNLFFHSKYRPREEARRLVDSAGLDPGRPVLVVGLGLGYHVLELLERSTEVAVVEPNPAVAKAALEGPMAGSIVLLGIGGAETIIATDGFKQFARRSPQVLLHPPTHRRHPGFAEAIKAGMQKAAAVLERFSIAVVGPMFGGSLPIAAYLERAFARLGHRTVLVDNSAAWDLYDAMSRSTSRQGMAGQLTVQFTKVLSEWTLSRVVDFAPDVCIVLAQAPVTVDFPRGLAQNGIVSAFWFVENWRHMGYWKDIAREYDYFFHLQPGEFEAKLKEAGCKRQACIQTACDPEIHKPVDLSADEQAEAGCDISFAGAGYRNRQQFFMGLTDFDFKLWGVEWNAQELQRLVCRPGERFTPEFFAKVVAASKINLNLHSSANHDGVDPHCDTINPRVFEIAACGGFQLCDPCIGLDTVFEPETELPVYHDLAELRTKIGHYLEHPEERQVIAEHARERALREHTYEHRARRMLDLVADDVAATGVRKGVTRQRSVAEMAATEGIDPELKHYLESLPPGLLFTYDTIIEQIASKTEERSYPEKVFAYLRQVRRAAEALLGEA